MISTKTKEQFCGRHLWNYTVYAGVESGKSFYFPLFCGVAEIEGTEPHLRPHWRSGLFGTTAEANEPNTFRIRKRGFARQPYCMAGQWKLFALERTFVPMGKRIYCSCHATWMLCKTSIAMNRPFIHLRSLQMCPWNVNWFHASNFGLTLS